MVGRITNLYPHVHGRIPAFEMKCFRRLLAADIDLIVGGNDTLQPRAYGMDIRTDKREQW